MYLSGNRPTKLPVCSVFGCFSKTKSNKDIITFHKFPHRNTKRVIKVKNGKPYLLDCFRLWLRALKIPYDDHRQQDASGWFVCSLHFVENDYYYLPGSLDKRTLKRFAVPSLRLLPSPNSVLTNRCLKARFGVLKYRRFFRAWYNGKHFPPSQHLVTKQTRDRSIARGEDKKIKTDCSDAHGWSNEKLENLNLNPIVFKATNKEVVNVVPMGSFIESDLGFVIQDKAAKVSEDMKTIENLTTMVTSAHLDSQSVLDKLFSDEAEENEKPVEIELNHFGDIDKSQNDDITNSENVKTQTDTMENVESRKISVKTGNVDSVEKLSNMECPIADRESVGSMSCDDWTRTAVITAFSLSDKDAFAQDMEKAWCKDSEDSDMTVSDNKAIETSHTEDKSHENTVGGPSGFSIVECHSLSECTENNDEPSGLPVITSVVSEITRNLESTSGMFKVTAFGKLPSPVVSIAEANPLTDTDFSTYDESGLLSKHIEQDLQKDLNGHDRSEVAVSAISQELENEVVTPYYNSWDVKKQDDFHGNKFEMLNSGDKTETQQSRNEIDENAVSNSVKVNEIFTANSSTTDELTDQVKIAPEELDKDQLQVSDLSAGNIHSMDIDKNPTEESNEVDKLPRIVNVESRAGDTNLSVADMDDTLQDKAKAADEKLGASNSLDSDNDAVVDHQALECDQASKNNIDDDTDDDGCTLLSESQNLGGTGFTSELIIKEEPNSDYESEQDAEMMEFVQDPVVLEAETTNGPVVVSQEKIADDPMEQLQSNNNELEVNNKGLGQKKACDNQGVNFRSHGSIRPDDNAFVCVTCGSIFEHRKQLANHGRIHARSLIRAKKNSVMNKKDVLQNTYSNVKKRLMELTCCVCGRILSAKTTLREHMLIHTGEKPHVCILCNKTFRHKANLVSHVNAHATVNEWVCKLCTQAFSSRTELRRHMNAVHKPAMLYCGICSKKFKTGKLLENHMATNHPVSPAKLVKQRDYKCEYCSRILSSSSTLREHMLIHSGEKPHECLLCGIFIRHRANFVMHVRSHSRGISYPCSLCSEAFPRKSELAEHIELVHRSAISLVKCEFCGEVFKKQAEFLKHSCKHNDLDLTV